MLKNLQLSKDKLLLILLGGVLLVIISLPVKDKNKTIDTYTVNEAESAVDYMGETGIDYAAQLEGRLEKILSQVEGAGQVMVLVTFEDSGELIVKSDVTESSKTDGVTAEGEMLGEKKREENVVFSKDSNGALSPYITKTIYPKISGVLVLAQGASDTEVMAKLTEAVSAALGIEINKIKVMKMEG